MLSLYHDAMDVLGCPGLMILLSFHHGAQVTGYIMMPWMYHDAHVVV